MNGLKGLTMDDPDHNMQFFLNGKYLFRIWFLNDPENAVNTTFSLQVYSE